MKKNVSSILVNNKKYSYSLEEKSEDVTFVTCKDANIAQEFLSEDVAGFLVDLPNLIIAKR